VAWNDVDLTKALLYNYRDSTLSVTVGASSIAIGTSAQKFILGSDRTHLMRKMVSDTIGADTDWEVRFEETVHAQSTWVQNGGVSIGTHFGNEWDFKKGRELTFEDATGGTFFCITTKLCDNAGVARSRGAMWARIDGVNVYTAGTVNLVIGTKYYITLTYSAHGGAANVHHVDMIIRTGSHTGTVVDTLSCDCGNASDTHDLICFSPCASPESWDAAYSNQSYWTIENVQTDFDHGSDDQSVHGHYAAYYDLTTFTKVDTAGDFSQASNLLSAINVDRKTSDARIYKDLTEFPSGAWTAHCKYKVSGSDWWFCNILSFADEADTKKIILDNSKNMFGPSVYFNGSVTQSARISEIVAGSESASAFDTGIGWPNSFLEYNASFDPSSGTYGTLTAKISIQHPELMPWSFGIISKTLSATPSAMKYFFAYQSPELTSGAIRKSDIDIKNVYGSWLEGTASTPGGGRSMFSLSFPRGRKRYQNRRGSIWGIGGVGHRKVR